MKHTISISSIRISIIAALLSYFHALPEPLGVLIIGERHRIGFALEVVEAVENGASRA